MTVGERIQSIIKEKGYRSMLAFYKELKHYYQNDAISYGTLTKIFANQRTRPHEQTLNQIALVLDVPTAELRKDLPVDENPDPGFYCYDDKATLYSYNVKAPFLPLKLSLAAGGRTNEEYDSPDVPESCKWILVIVGNVCIHIKGDRGEEKHCLHKGQTALFDARKPHYFENASKGYTILHIIHYPATNNSLNFI